MNVKLIKYPSMEDWMFCLTNREKCGIIKKKVDSMTVLSI